MKSKVIKDSEIEDYKGKVCPECKQGKMELVPDHDAMLGNSTKLKCSQKVAPCGFTIEILSR